MILIMKGAKDMKVNVNIKTNYSKKFIYTYAEDNIIEGQQLSEF